MSKPTLCVIVPVYKAAATLDRCVASVLAQQVAGGLHCILVDDGSPDESGDLCDAYYLPCRWRSIRLVWVMAEARRTGSPLFGKLDWAGYYLLGRRLRRD